MSGLPLRTLVDVWANSVAKWPRKAAVVAGGRDYSYGEIDELSGRLARRLRDDFGIRRGDTVSVAMPNCIEFYITYWAVMKLGAVLAPVNTRLKFDELHHVLTNTGSTTLLTHGETWPGVAEPARGAANLEHLIGADAGGTDLLAFDDLLAPVEPLPPDLTVQPTPWRWPRR